MALWKEVLITFTEYLMIAFVIFCILIFIIRYKPAISRYMELTGYFLLIVSLMWTFLSNNAAETERKYELRRIDQKLDLLMAFESSKLEGSLDEEELLGYFKLQQKTMRAAHSLPEVIEWRLKAISLINYVLLALSSLLVTVGRLSEMGLLTKPIRNSKVNKNYRKPVKRGRRKSYRRN